MPQHRRKFARGFPPGVGGYGAGYTRHARAQLELRESTPDYLRASVQISQIIRRGPVTLRLLSRLPFSREVIEQAVKYLTQHGEAVVEGDTVKAS